EALRVGSFLFLETGRNLVCYARFTEDEQMVVAINSGTDSMKVTLPVWEAGVPNNCEMEQIMITSDMGHSIMPVRRTVEGGRLAITLKPYNSVVLRYR
ncbi:MAG: alpha-glucosidase C-terminal domain-containing protein, partial [Lachnospiraceae bacterium]|nr:alpha-glucosidase C-terminal domain-containing protein [Lachnospiraceae bacterium]